jgi:rod shape-determining protein MreC
MKKVFLTILVLIIILILLNIIPGLNKGLGNFVYKIFSPIGRFFSNIGNGISGFFQIITSISDLNEENLALKKGNLVLEAENSTLIEVKRENDILREALNISKSGEQIQEVASVVGKDIQGIQDWVLINKGSRHGITKDMVVISPENTLVGRISEVDSSFSKVALITQKDSVVAGIIENNRTEGLIKRDDKGGLFIDFIPKNESMEIGERIITSGMDNLYPKGILIGKIEIIDTSDNQIFQKIIIAPAVDFSKLEEVFIIK